MTDLRFALVYAFLGALSMDYGWTWAGICWLITAVITFGSALLYSRERGPE